MPDSPDLIDRVVVVTGAAGRLGRVVVGQLAAAGAHVAALDREALDAGPFSVAADVTDEASVRRAFDAVEAELGAPHAVVHTVGMWDGAPFADTELADWETVLRVNLTSAFLVFREGVRRLAAGGRLVGIASGQGADRGVAQQAAYSASKAGVVRLVESVSAEHDALAAVALAPSTILFGGEEAGTDGVSVDEVAGWCVRLCGPEADAYDGQVVRAYGSAG